MHSLTYMHVCDKLTDIHLKKIAILMYLIVSIIILCSLIDCVYTNCIVFISKTHFDNKPN